MWPVVLSHNSQAPIFLDRTKLGQARASPSREQAVRQGRRDQRDGTAFHMGTTGLPWLGRCGVIGKSLRARIIWKWPVPSGGRLGRRFSRRLHAASGSFQEQRGSFN
jgi:hypothetical protein